MHTRAGRGDPACDVGEETGAQSGGCHHWWSGGWRKEVNVSPGLRDKEQLQGRPWGSCWSVLSLSS